MVKYIKVGAVSTAQGIHRYGDLSRDLHFETDRMVDGLTSLLKPVLAEKPDLIVLPETCDEYYNYPLERRMAYYNVRGNRIRNVLMALAEEHACYIAYSAVRKTEDGTFRNSTQLITPKGDIAGIYNKNHPTLRELQLRNVLSGKDAKTITCDFGTIACGICFDLHFDPLWDAYKPQKPDIILYSSACHGGLMQNYRAYQLGSYFIGAIIDSENTIISPIGETLKKSADGLGYLTGWINLDYAVVSMDTNREKIKKVIAEHGNDIRVNESDLLGAAMLVCETDRFTIRDIIEAYQIELLDEYFKRCLFRQKNQMEP